MMTSAAQPYKILGALGVLAVRLFFQACIPLSRQQKSRAARMVRILLSFQLNL
jgi:hypothetical protein